MTREEHLLDILIEECAEVIQRVTMAKRFGLLEVQPAQELNNQQRIILEFCDLAAVVEMLFGVGCDDPFYKDERNAKLSII